MYTKLCNKILSLILGLSLLLTQTGITAFAEGGAALDVSGEITAFAALGEDVAEQNVPLGTSQSELKLPETLMATAAFAAIATGGVTSADPATMDIPVPVTWASQPQYDGNTAGIYSFTADCGGFILAAAPPVITVAVGDTPQAGKLITAFAELDDAIRTQRGSSLWLILPETAEATVDGVAAQVPVTWEAEGYGGPGAGVSGLYVFIAKPVGDYALAGGVEPPKITAMLISMAFMAGAGTSASPLQITNAAQLAKIIMRD